MAKGKLIGKLIGKGVKYVKNAAHSGAYDLHKANKAAKSAKDAGKQALKNGASGKTANAINKAGSNATGAARKVDVDLANAKKSLSNANKAREAAKQTIKKRAIIAGGAATAGRYAHNKNKEIEDLKKQINTLQNSPKPTQQSPSTKSPEEKKPETNNGASNNESNNNSKSSSGSTRSGGSSIGQPRVKVRHSVGGSSSSGNYVPRVGVSSVGSKSNIVKSKEQGKTDRYKMKQEGKTERTRIRAERSAKRQSEKTARQAKRQEQKSFRQSNRQNRRTNRRNR